MRLRSYRFNVKSKLLNPISWWSTIIILGASLLMVTNFARADAAGDAMLDKCIDAERKLTIMQANYTLHGSDIPSMHGEVSLKKPNLGHITVVREGSADILISHSDGKTLTVFSTEKKQFEREAVDLGGGNLTRDCEVLEVAAFYNPDILDRMRFGLNARLVATATLLGTPCRVVQVNGDAKSVWKIYIGPDNLLRGYSQKVHRGDQTITRESRLTGLKVGGQLSPALMAWTVPKGAKSSAQVAAIRNAPSSGTGTEEQGLLPIGKMAPAFNLPEMGAASINLAGAAKLNKATLVNFWSSYCGPCREELPQLNKMLAQLHSKGFDILSINIGDNEKIVSKIWKEGHFTMHALLHGDQVSNTYHIEAIPTNYLVGTDGKILARFVGFDEQGIRGALAKSGIK